MILCEHRAWLARSRPGPAGPGRTAAARTRGYCWSKVTEWSGARGGFILARRVPWGSAQVPAGPVTLLGRVRATVSGPLGSSASSAGFWGACTASSHRRDPRPPLPSPPAQPGIGRGTEHRGSQTQRKAEPRGSELTDGRKTGMAARTMAASPATVSGLRSWAEMERAWTESLDVPPTWGWGGGPAGGPLRLPAQCLRLEMGVCTCTCVIRV